MKMSIIFLRLVWEVLPFYMLKDYGDGSSLKTGQSGEKEYFDPFS
jgi:hypothetical protein